MKTLKKFSQNLEKIRNLGDTGETVNVKDGYGRNFLLKTGKALRADKKNIEFVKRKKDEINEKNVEQKKYAKKIFEKIWAPMGPHNVKLFVV